MKSVVILSIIKLTRIIINVTDIMLIGSMLSVTAPKKVILFYSGHFKWGKGYKMVASIKNTFMFFYNNIWNTLTVGQMTIVPMRLFHPIIGLVVSRNLWLILLSNI
jgi:hypothetical protein